MSVRERKERERANRHRLIVSTARELAETHGWEAVTTRRLAEQIEYSQPVLYSHFRGKSEIVGAVALEGFAELTGALRAAVPDGTAGREAVGALARAYTDFAARNPALYDAMFSLDNGLAFADETTPAPLREAFQALLDPLVDHAHPDEPALFAETFWAALHGLVTLTRAGRLPAPHVTARLTLLADRFVPR
ncbi:TetR/AcrR family transcriptional regulator [Streptomyces roseifaciens]